MTNLFIAASLSAFFFGIFGVTWEAVDDRIQQQYPDVESISTQQLYLRSQGEGEPLPVLIDVRELAEFRVSHLAGAKNIETGAAIAGVFADKDTPIVVYCSVGYRSAGVAADLEELGYTNVLNLHHSLFEWANKDLPMVNESGTTDAVHPYNRTWGGLVDSSRHQYTAQ